MPQSIPVACLPWEDFAVAFLHLNTGFGRSARFAIVCAVPKLIWKMLNLQRLTAHES